MAAMAPPGGGRNAFSQRLQVSQLLMHPFMQLCSHLWNCVNLDQSCAQLQRQLQDSGAPVSLNIT